MSSEELPQWVDFVERFISTVVTDSPNGYNLFITQSFCNSQKVSTQPVLIQCSREELG